MVDTWGSAIIRGGFIGIGLIVLVPILIYVGISLLIVFWKMINSKNNTTRTIITMVVWVIIIFLMLKGFGSIQDIRSYPEEEYINYSQY